MYNLFILKFQLYLYFNFIYITIQPFKRLCQTATQHPNKMFGTTFFSPEGRSLRKVVKVVKVVNGRKTQIKCLAQPFLTKL
jgi:3-hydroxyacyl-CoA dehydrogenase